MTARELVNMHLDIGRVVFESMGYHNTVPIVHLRKEGVGDVAVHVYGQDSLYAAVLEIIKICPYVPDSIVIMGDTCAEFVDENDRERLAELLAGDSTVKRFNEARGNPHEALDVVAITPTEYCHGYWIYRWTPVDGWEWDERSLFDLPSSTPRMWEWDRIMNGEPQLMNVENLGEARWTWQ